MKLSFGRGESSRFFEEVQEVNNFAVNLALVDKLKLFLPKTRIDRVPPAVPTTGKATV